MRLNDKQAVRLLPIGRDLCQELVRRYPSGSCEVQFLVDLLTDHLRDPRRRGQFHLVLGHVEIRLVERQRFDQVGMPLKDFAHSPRYRFVTDEIRGNEDRVWA